MTTREAGAPSRLALPVIGLVVVVTAAGSVAGWSTVLVAVFSFL